MNVAVLVAPTTLIAAALTKPVALNVAVLVAPTTLIAGAITNMLLAINEAPTVCENALATPVV